jgi:peroxin-1
MKQDANSPLNFATQTEGYSATDLKDLVARAIHQAAITSTQRSAEGAEVRLLGH